VRLSPEVDGLRVQDLMDRNHPFLYPDEQATKARAVLRDRGLRVLPVVDERRRLFGMISRGDVMAITSSVSLIRVKGIVATPKFVATAGMDANEAAKEMIRLDEWYVPVVKSSQDSTYVGVLGLEHLMHAFLEKNKARASTPLSQVMSTKLIVCSPEDEADNVWRVMQKRSYAACPVVSKGRLVGIVTQKNLLDSGAVSPAFESEKGRFKSPPKIQSVMKTPVVSLKPTNTVKDAAELMLKRNIGRVPVADEKGRLVGMVDREDVVRALIE